MNRLASVTSVVVAGALVAALLSSVSSAQLTASNVTPAATMPAAAVPPKAPGSPAPPGVDTAGIHDALAGLVEAGLQLGGVDDLIDHFVEADRARVDDTLPDETDDFDDAATGVVLAWEAKFRRPLDPGDDPSVFERVRIEPIAGGPGGPSTRPTAPSEGAASLAAAVAETAVPPATAVRVTFPAAFGAAELGVTMARTPGGWMVDVPDHVDGRRLHQALVAHLTELRNRHVQWPTDPADAYAVFAHRLLLAVHDKASW